MSENKDLSREQIIDILKYIGVSKIIDHGKSNIQFCCPVHGESTPSMGYSFDKEVCNCFSCHFSGSIEWLVLNAMPSDFKSIRDVQRWIYKTYGVNLLEKEKVFGRALRRYGIEILDEEPQEETTKVLPLSYIAPFKSGKQTYKYFYERGFTKKTLQDFRIGRDLEKKTVTVPVFHQDGRLAGVIGRYIDPNRPKNSRYAVYEFSKSSTLYPIHKFEPKIWKGKKVAILVEGILDGLWLHQCGHSEGLAMLGNELSPKQTSIIKDLDIDILILAVDDDKGGVIAKDIIKKQLKDTVTYKDVVYPKGCKDVQEMTKEQIDTMIDQCLNKKKKIRRM